MITIKHSRLTYTEFLFLRYNRLRREHLPSRIPIVERNCARFLIRENVNLN